MTIGVTYMRTSNVRQQTCYLMELMDEGVLDPKAVAEACLVWLSEDDVRGMSKANELPVFDDEDDEDDEE